MRVLLVHPPLPPSFWSMERSGWIEGTKSLAPPMGLLTVAALLPPEWQVRLVDENNRAINNSDWQWADLVLVSGMIIQTRTLVDLVGRAKSWGKTVVAGGPGPTSMPEALMAAGCDLLVRGEAENLMPPLLQAIREGRSGRIFETPDYPTLTGSPTPRFDLLELKDYTIMGVQTARGCPHDCEFCDVVNLYGRRVRKKTPDQVMAEMEALFRLGWRRDILFTDDNFIGDRSHALEILDRLIPWMKSHGEPFGFITQASVKLGQDRDLIDRLTEANFWGVFIGIESLDDAALQQARKFQNLQSSTVEDMNAIRDNGLEVIASFILGYDGEQPGAGDRIAAFVKATQIPMVMLNLLVPIPGTRLWRRLETEGRLLVQGLDVDWARCAQLGSNLMFRPIRPEEEILTEYRQAWQDLLEPRNYLSRAYEYFLHMRPTRAAMARIYGRTPPPASSTSISRHKGYGAGRRLWSFLKLSWHQGVAAASRWHYWRYLWGLWRRNPSRLMRFLSIVGLGVDLFAYRKQVLGRLDGRHRWPLG